ncbi:MAG TPA: HlyD family efflux transporter periplasmic adaptor subunit, partial [Sandaracinaceae bacterium LLY-WYZ-13_1]|nr:HlyD family efflux transporter periplasmic adaptor subunit [Sandaracinaceae bacterium LLY-WYZ-13_1]
MIAAVEDERRPPPLPAKRLVAVPLGARRLALLLAVAFVAFVVVALVAPWQQNITGGGRVIAYAPLERQQPVDAPVSGRVIRWFVQEGSVVSEGDPIVQIADNDPRLLARLRQQRQALRERLDSYEERVEAAETRVDAVGRGQTEAIRAAEASVDVAERDVSAARQSVSEAEAELETARINLVRRRALAREGLSSQREVELAQLAVQQAFRELQRSEARVAAKRSELARQQAELSRARADAEAERADARADLEASRTDVADTRRTLAELRTRIARQLAQLVSAPRDGTIFRVVANQGGEQVSAGEPLAILVPDTEARAVELWVDGNDAAIISAGSPARLQFEGWPAVQFTGWPSAAVGTFPGEVAFVDATDDGRGNFRVVVVPRDGAGEEPWPERRFLRQGTRANGWVLLREVTIGYELWRQMN